MNKNNGNEDFGYESGKGSAHNYLPAWMKVPALHETENRADAHAIIKFFTPDSNWTWYVVETDRDEGLCFGLVVGMCTELGYFSIEELESVRGPFGLKIERDRFFRPTAVKNLPEYQREWPNGGPYEAIAARAQ